RAHHHRARPARAARRDVPAAERRDDAAQESPGLRPRPPRRAVCSDLGDRSSAGTAAPGLRRSMWSHIAPAFRITLVFTVLTGLLYPAAVTGVAELVFPEQAPGALITGGGRTGGSAVIDHTLT